MLSRAYLFCDKTEEDILLRESLEQFQRDHPDRFKLWYTVDRPGEGKNISGLKSNEDQQSLGFYSAI